ncbi:hypothetical protein BE17_35885 [Sorangium cellulosum]|uniref:Uncharacterized protein n=1 Tax=Sorangium cellulosum TaxID=56 RepID=A0A150R4V1_SORCE|nr:hypothetical protein BE17_35885 [Sorangium cellulosum]
MIPCKLASMRGRVVAVLVCALAACSESPTDESAGGGGTGPAGNGGSSSTAETSSSAAEGSTSSSATGSGGGGGGDGGAGGGEPESACASVSDVPSELGLDPFYKKYIDAAGIPVISSEKTPDAALLRACSVVTRMLGYRDDVRQAMIANHTRVAVMAETEVTTDIPEHSDLYEAFPGTDWDTRARGLGATPARPASSCAEENVLCYPSDPYLGEDILVHEFSHAIAIMGIAFAEPTFDQELEDVFEGAIQAGKWADTYAATNKDEYWAEGVQDWFDTNIESIPGNGIHNEINTRAELRDYDRPLHDLIARYFPDDAWRPTCP